MGRSALVSSPRPLAPGAVHAGLGGGSRTAAQGSGRMQAEGPGPAFPALPPALPAQPSAPASPEFPRPSPQATQLLTLYKISSILSFTNCLVIILMDGIGHPALGHRENTLSSSLPAPV